MRTCEHFAAVSLAGLALAAALGDMVSASTRTMGFAGGELVGDTYVENGIVMTGFLDGFFRDQNPAAHLDNPGDGHFTDRLSFSAGLPFDLVSFDILPLPFLGCDGCAPYDNVTVSGFRGAAPVAHVAFFMGGLPSTYLAPAAFSLLDRLVVSALNGPGPEYDLANIHFEIDNFTIRVPGAASPAPVPLPPALLLLAGSLAPLAAVALRRRRSERPRIARD